MSRAPDNSRPSREDGFTMIELIVAMAMMVIIAGAAVSLLITAFQAQPEITARSNQVGTARVAINRIVNEIRQGVVGPSTEASGSGLVLDTYVDGTCGTSSSSADPCRVTYSCVDDSCTRSTEGVDGSIGGPETVVSGIANPTAVFEGIEATSNCPEAGEENVVTYVSVTLEFPGAEERESPTTLSDGAGLRSCRS